MALVICHDVDSVTGEGLQGNQPSNSLNSTITSNILNLHNCGVRKFVFVFLENAKSLIDELISFFCHFLPDCVIQFQEELDHSIGLGDIIMSKFKQFEEESSFLVVSWRNVPSSSILEEFMRLSSTNTSVLGSTCNHSVFHRSIPFNPQTDFLIEMDSNDDSPVEYAADYGLYMFQTSVLSQLPSSFPSACPISCLSLLHYINQTVPNSVRVILTPSSSLMRDITLSVQTGTDSAINKESLCMLIDGAMVHAVHKNEKQYTFHTQALVGSCLRYVYGTADESAITSFESRMIPREVFIPSGNQPFCIEDTISSPFTNHMILYDSYLVILSLERWRIQSNLRFKSISVDEKYLRKLTSSTIVYSMDSLDDASIEIEDVREKKVFTILLSKDELTTILTKPSSHHQDGTIRKKMNGSEIELKVTVLSQHTTSSSITHSLLNGYSHSYKPKHSPLFIGHRGCGVNRLSGQTEIENSLHGFVEAASRGLTTVEFDLQLSKDQQVVVFHDYTIPMKNQQVPIASQCVDTLKSIPLPQPDHYVGPGESLPLMKEMVTSTPSSLNFNIEVKYPMINELEMAGVNCSKNEYADKIITTVQDCQSCRTIYYSSFDPEVCYHLLYKQANYPVFLLLDEESGCLEINTMNWRKGAWKTYLMLALEKGPFRGVVAAVPLLDESSVKWIHSLGLLVYCWGKEGNDSEQRSYLSSIGVDAIIADSFSV